MNFQSKSSNIEHRVTDVKINEFIFVWEIRDFKSYDFKLQSELVSPQFSSGGDKKHLWNLCVSKNQEYLSLVLAMAGCGTEARVILILSICGQENEKVSKEVLFLAKRSHETEKRSFPDFVQIAHLLDEKNKLLVNGTLTISCKLCYQDVIDSNQTEKSNSLVKNDVSCVLNSLFEHKILSDVKIVIGRKEFQAHKCILAARSRVFSAMFEHDMLEKNESKVVIEDIDAKIMDAVLRFMYCGKINDGEPLTDLLVVANKYELEGLKIICEDKLIDSLNGQNIGETLIFADRYKAEKLKKHALNFIFTRAKDINFEKFKTDVELHSPLLVDLVGESKSYNSECLISNDFRV